MAQAEALEARYGQTHRTDRWWLEPLVTGSGLLIFVLYSTVVGVLGEVWSFEAFAINADTGEEVGIYLSPFFEPLLHPGWAPDWISPAIFILWAPIGFRTTCYYYRRTYYRAYFLSPPACAVKEPASSYSGESGFPLVLQNAHRWFMYVALLFIPILWVGAIKSFHVPGEGFGVGVGSLVLTLNAFLLMMYTIGCHSLRHWVAGGLNQFSRSPLRRVRRRAWEVFTVANEHHRLWAWTSLIWVGATDLYVRLVANDLITDLNTWSNF
jgi:hypothetical protein